MDEKARLIQQLDDAREKLQAVLAGIDPQTEIYPNWTLKELFAHLTGWDEAVTSSLRAHAGGEEPAALATLGIDVYNKESVETRDALSYEQTVKECELAREQLKAALHEMPSEKLVEPLLYPWGPTGTVARLITIFVHHDLEHAEEIQALKAKA
jgi:uncharacterized protein (TIGR03083 family)